MGTTTTDRRSHAPGLAEVQVARGEHGGPGADAEADWVVVEEPLQIRVGGEPLAVTLRTPGHDRELAAGFVFTEGVIDGPGDLISVEISTDLFESSHPENTVNVTLVPGRGGPDRIERASRDFRAVSACGVCGKKTIESLRQRIPEIVPLAPSLALIRDLPERMRLNQCLFHVTGGIHAAALFDPGGELLTLFEDVGRHNAVDKVIGDALLRATAPGAAPDSSATTFPLGERILVTSGRAGFEVVQKALRAGIPALASVGAASSLAADLAHDSGMALYSFVGRGRGHRHV